MKTIQIHDGMVAGSTMTIGEPTLVIGSNPGATIKSLVSPLFRVKNNDSQFPVVFRDFQVNAQVGGVVIDYIGSAIQNTHRTKMVDISGVSIAGSGNLIGVRLAYAYNGSIRDLMVTGTGHIGSRGVVVDGLSTNLRISDSQLNFLGNGILVDGYHEGLVVANSYMIDVVRGIAFVNPEPLRSSMAVVNSCHIDARGPSSRAIHAENLDGLLVSNCYLIAGGPVIYGKKIFQSNISSSQLFMAGGEGVILTELGDQGCNGVTVACSTFHGEGTCVQIGKKSHNIVVQNNTRSERFQTYPYDPVPKEFPVTVADLRV
jgi:hypothetical protein